MRRDNINGYAKIPDDVHQAYVEAVHGLKEEPAVRHKIPTALIFALVAMLLTGIALAAAHFGVLDFITYRDADGNEKFNEALISHIVPINQTLEGEASSVTIHDAVCDGAAMSLAWTIHNKLPNEEVYVYWYLSFDEPNFSYGTGDMTPNEFMLSGGQNLEGGITTRLLSPVEDETLHLYVYFSVLAPNREIVSVDGFADINPFLEEDVIVMQHDMIYLPYENYLEDESKAEALVRLGYMQSLDTFVIPLELTITGGLQNILAYADTTQIETEDYRMLLTSIECTPTTLRYTVDFLFDDQSMAESFMAERHSMVLYPPFDETDIWYGIAESGNQEGIVEENGVWVVRHLCDITDILQMPNEIDIIPFDAHTNEPYHAGEGFHVSIPKQ